MNSNSYPFMTKSEYLVEIIKRIRLKLFFYLIPKSLQLSVRKMIKD